MNKKVIIGAVLSLVLVAGVVSSLVLVKNNQDIRSKAAGCTTPWPANPAYTCGKATQTPAQGATNVSLTPHFHWEYGGYSPANSACVEPSGCVSYYANIYLYENSDPGPKVGFFSSGQKSSPVHDANLSDFDSTTLKTLKPNQKYYWTVTPGICSDSNPANCITHAEQKWSYYFTTGAESTPPPTCDTMTMTPPSTSVATSGEQRTLVASGSIPGQVIIKSLKYNWSATGGTFTPTEGNTITWTAPTLGTTGAQWTISATVTDDLGQTSSVGGCTKTLSYSPPGSPVCNSVTMTPASTIVTAGGQTREFTVNATGGQGNLTYTWSASGGVPTTGTGSTFTWTAPSTLTADQTWTISATATDSLGQTSAPGNCTKVLTYTVLPAGVCQKVEPSKLLSSIKIGDQVTFTGWGSIGVANTDTIDKINFTVFIDGVKDIEQTVDTTPDTTLSTSTIKYYKASLNYTVRSAGSYSVVIKVHQSSDASTIWKL